MALTQTAEVAPKRNPYSDISRTVQILAAWRGLSQADIASALDVHPSMITRSLKGQRKWQIEDLFALAELFGVPPTKFLEDPEALVQSRCIALRGSHLATVDGGAKNTGSLTLDDFAAELAAQERRSHLKIAR